MGNNNGQTMNNAVQPLTTTVIRSLGYGHAPPKELQSPVSQAGSGKTSQDSDRSGNSSCAEEDTSSSVSKATNNLNKSPVQRASQQSHHPPDSNSDANMSSIPSTPIIPSNITQPNLIPDHVFISSAGKPYDRDWIVKHGIDETILQGFSSKHQFRSLVSNDAIKLGDKLRVRFQTANGAVNKEGTLIKSPRACPDILIPVTRPNVASITLHDCAGPVDFINAMNDEFSATLGCSVSSPNNWGAWRTVSLVSSEGYDFGTLWKVRQAYHVWVEEKDKWAVRVGGSTAKHSKSVHARPSTNVPGSCARRFRKKK